MRALGLRLLVTLVLLLGLALLFAVSIAGAEAPAPRAAAPATNAPLAGSGDSASFLGAGVKLLVASLVLAGLLYFAMRGVRRLPIARFLPSADGPIRMIARTHLGARESLCLIEVGGTRLLVGVSGQGMETLHVWPDAADVDGSRSATAAGRPRLSITVPGQLRSLEARLPGGRR